MRLTAIGNSSGDKSDCSVGIIAGSTYDGLAGTRVTVKKPCKRGYCLVANLSVRVRGQNVDEVCYNIGDAEVLCAASLTRKTMQRKLAHRCNGIAESKTKYVPRGIARVVVQKKQAGSSNTRIRVSERADLQGSKGHLAAAARSTLLRKRAPSTDKVIGDFKVRSRHGGRHKR